MNLDTLKSLWQARNPRERWLIGVGLPLLVLSLLYVYLWMPLDKERQRLRQSVPALRIASQKLQQQAQEAQSLKQRVPQGQDAAPADLAAMLRQSAASQGLREPQVTQASAEQLRVSLAEADFGALIRWLEFLQSQHGLRAQALEIKALSEQGKVAAQVTLSSGLGA
ncbi:MAG: type II secretion system protein GspM [Pseudomonadota bacterium]